MLPEFQVVVLAPDSAVLLSSCIHQVLLQQLLAAIRSIYHRCLLGKVNKEKVIEVFAQIDISYHFVCSDRYSQFADWRFVFKARLGTINNARIMAT